MNKDLSVYVLMIVVFFAVAIIVIMISKAIEKWLIITKRMNDIIDSGPEKSLVSDYKIPQIIERISVRVDDKLISNLVSDQKRTSLHSELIQAGFFQPNSPTIYIGLSVFCILIGGAFGVYLVTNYMGNALTVVKIMALVTSAYAGYFIPDIYIRTRTNMIKQEYVSVFPDFLDLLVVCVDAGLSLNAALDRVTSEFYSRSRPLAINFEVLLTELRIGREMTDAFSNLSSRIGIDDIKSFCTLLKQSSELGSNITDALRVYSDDMRLRRYVRAEEEANKLPVKMLAPLSLFIFPVILIVILTPAVIRFSHVGQ
jgi:tight adherence protein C